MNKIERIKYKSELHIDKNVITILDTSYISRLNISNLEKPVSIYKLIDDYHEETEFLRLLTKYLSSNIRFSLEIIEEYEKYKIEGHRIIKKISRKKNGRKVNLSKDKKECLNKAINIMAQNYLTKRKFLSLAKKNKLEDLLTNEILSRLPLIKKSIDESSNNRKDKKFIGENDISIYSKMIAACYLRPTRILTRDSDFMTLIKNFGLHRFKMVQLGGLPEIPYLPEALFYHQGKLSFVRAFEEEKYISLNDDLIF